ncbi:ATP-binding protein [Streptomyces formicae]|uniref:ATP-binding protein n=1 Tax=Streptomyces formicae TaxID=1616117 RepID=UPI0036204586
MTVQVISARPCDQSDVSRSPYWRLDCSAKASGRARRLVRECLQKWDLDELIDSALLVTSELVTNAVVHAASPAGMGLSLRLDAGAAGDCRVWILVRDHGVVNALPPSASPTSRCQDLFVCSGRGLALVEHLAEAWGDITDAGGHTVWACLGRAC